MVEREIRCGAAVANPRALPAALRRLPAGSDPQVLSRSPGRLPTCSTACEASPGQPVGGAEQQQVLGGVVLGQVVRDGRLAAFSQPAHRPRLISLRSRVGRLDPVCPRD